ncbi:MAG: hypothetical protein A3E00_04920 [Curvibacter sp. RIFCSPHIGHO2_12_FULL_63_18]|uniref:DUF6776 family protein n=1 Tax=Rhodoferax sp. TaxID=50421 RepID=UPI0008B6CB87|nr:DUF6776 family protein [Rhodoferax sp.]OGO95903.1 MAG: hypothetical protein A2037_12535 [Curvibacter sp. GWA2_63_95]OGP01569.1 MAG: hypothetical protein A3E00_04920 [Curvibacter sp. RIFCSPHIGHO2_12_FULL_63_18]HCX83464.1 hypothetical protein [Rhodoferax sp.]
MRFRLLRRRLTISAPRMAVRSALPWPFRWAVLAIVLGFCAAIGLWAFEFGKDIAGLEKGSKDELLQLRTEVTTLRSELVAVKAERDEAQSVANTADTLVTAEKASHEKLLAQVKQLEADNRLLRDDLGFFEKLIPAGAVEGLAIRGLQAELIAPTTLKWQALVMQPGRNTQEFNGRLEITFAGTVNGKPWTATLPDGPMPIKVKQYGRMEGELALPPQVLVKSVSARVLEGAVVRAAQSIKL